MVKAIAQSIGLLVAGLAALISVVAIFATVPGWNPLQIAFVLAMTLAAFVGLWGLTKGRAWGALLIALWAALGVAEATMNFSNITGIDGFRIPFAFAGLIELGAAITLATAPRAKAS